MFDPRRITDILSELHARRGYARVRETESCEQAWKEAAGAALAAQTRCGSVKRGVLEITAANNMVAQELQFEKVRIVERLAELLPEEKIRDVRCRIGAVR